MDSQLTVYIFGAVAVMIAGVSKGGFGGGLGFLATPLLALATGPERAAAIVLPVLILIDQVGLVTYWSRWRWDLARPALIAAAVGIGIGALVFGAIDADFLRLGLGFIAISFLAFQVAQARGWTVSARRGDGGGGAPARGWICGAAAGFTSTISHAGGPPIAIYLLGEKAEKTDYQATTVLIFWAINLMKLVPYALLGLLGGETLAISASLAPAAIVGVLIGVWAHKRLPQTWFVRIVSALLLITGAKLIWDGVAGVLGRNE